jgi:hypothetical protein
MLRRVAEEDACVTMYELDVEDPNSLYDFDVSDAPDSTVISQNAENDSVAATDTS